MYKKFAMELAGRTLRVDVEMRDFMQSERFREDSTKEKERLLRMQF